MQKINIHLIIFCVDNQEFDIIFKKRVHLFTTLIYVVIIAKFICLNKLLEKMSEKFCFYKIYVFFIVFCVAEDKFDTIFVKWIYFDDIFEQMIAKLYSWSFIKSFGHLTQKSNFCSKFTFRTSLYKIFFRGLNFFRSKPRTKLINCLKKISS